MAGEKFLMMSENPTGSGSFSLNRRSNSAKGANSVAAGHNLVASGNYSHAEGIETQALGIATHAEGNKTIAKGNYSHAEGGSSRVPVVTTSSVASDIRPEWLDSYFNLAFGEHSHTEGKDTLALGSWSHAEGNMAGALADSSHAEGHVTRADNFGSHVSGKFNVAMTTGGQINNTTGTVFVIGNGTSPGAKSNAFSVQYNGVVKSKSTITASTTADYAEFFEWIDGNPEAEDRVGYFVTLDGDKIRIANNTDEYILGVVSGEPFVLGNGDCDTWTNMHLRDEFRRTIYEPAPKVIKVLDEEGNPTGEFEEVEGEFEGVRPKLNPDYDPTQEYVSRFDRPEWAPVGMLGVLAVRHDGTAQVNGYVTINEGGIATACELSTTHCYRVIKSNADNVVEIVFTSGNGIFVEGDVFVDGEESDTTSGSAQGGSNVSLAGLIKLDSFSTTIELTPGESQTPSVFIEVPEDYVIIAYNHSVDIGHLVSCGIHHQENVIGYNSDTRIVFNVMNNHTESVSPTITVNVTFAKKECVMS